MKKKNVLKPLIVKKAEKALKAASVTIKKLHRNAGLPLIVWKRGRVVKIPASQL